MRKKCSVSECKRLSSSARYCDKHYRRWKKHGDPTIVGRCGMTVAEALKTRVERAGDCILWTGAMTGEYGCVRYNGRSTRVHRVKWIETNGPIPDGMKVDHMCWNTRCINIDHLRLVTQAENLQYRPGPPANSTTGVRNVYRGNGGYRVSIKVNRKTTNFGTYPTLEQAADVAERVRSDLFGMYAGRGRAA